MLAPLCPQPTTAVQYTVVLTVQCIYCVGRAQRHLQLQTLTNGVQALSNYRYSNVLVAFGLQHNLAALAFDLQWIIYINLYSTKIIIISIISLQLQHKTKQSSIITNFIKQ